jgi:hypothetical protein
MDVVKVAVPLADTVRLFAPLSCRTKLSFASSPETTAATVKVLSEHTTATFATSARMAEPLPLLIVQFCPGGWVSTVTA